MSFIGHPSCIFQNLIYRCHNQPEIPSDTRVLVLEGTDIFEKKSGQLLVFTWDSFKFIYNTRSTLWWLRLRLNFNLRLFAQINFSEDHCLQQPDWFTFKIKFWSKSNSRRERKRKHKSGIKVNQTTYSQQL